MQISRFLHHGSKLLILVRPAEKFDKAADSLSGFFEFQQLFSFSYSAIIIIESAL
jgi:hypothetical protein